jgi:hypothetical protein
MTWAWIALALAALGFAAIVCKPATELGLRFLIAGAVGLGVLCLLLFAADVFWASERFRC